jgi:hypothetical protein
MFLDTYWGNSSEATGSHGKFRECTGTWRTAPRAAVLRIRIRDPVPFWPLDPGWVNIQDPDPGWTTRIILLTTIFWVKILKFFDADARSGMENIRIRIKILDPQHWRVAPLMGLKGEKNIKSCSVVEYRYFWPIRVSEEPVCIYLFRQNPVFTSLHLRSSVHVVPPNFQMKK